MKLIIIIMTTCLMQVSAASFAQKLTYSKKGATLEQIFTEIRKQTGYFVVFAENKVDKTAKLDVNFRNTELKNVLEVISNSQDLTYTFDDKNISLKPRESSFLDDVIARFQAIDVRGRVVDSLGNGLSGATITIKGSKQTTITGANGEFFLKNVEPNAIVIVTYMGYLSREMTASSEFIFVLLQQSPSKLDEIQVMAYGRTSKRLSTGNIVTIKAEELAKQPVTNPLMALQGRVPNLVITPTSGQPNSAVKVQLRGQNSLSTQSQRSEPLILIDGVPYQNTTRVGIGNATITADEISALSLINVNDIEQIDVLADADATSIYGSRGGNGVILITTKRGKSGKTTVNAAINMGISQVSKKLELMNTQQYLAMRSQAYRNDGLLVPDQNSTVKNMRNYDLTVWNPNRYTDWQKEFLGRNAVSYSANLNVQGGSPTVQYLLGGNYNTQGYVYPGDAKYENGVTNLNVSGNSADGKFKALLSSAVTFNYTFTPSADFTRMAITLAPNAPSIYTADGSLNWEPDQSFPGVVKPSTFMNPYAQLKRTSTVKGLGLRGSAELSYQFLSNLGVKIAAGYTRNTYNTQFFFPIASQDPSANPLASATYSDTEDQSFTLDPQLLYNTFIGKGKLEVLFGASYQSQDKLFGFTTADGYTSDALLKSIGNAAFIGAGNSSNHYRYVAGFGRLNYNLHNKYIINVSGRRDGSSRFGPGYQFGDFWSGGAAWIFSEESFAKKLVKVLSFGKLRASYGTSGNDGIGDYQYLELYRSENNIYDYQGVTPLISNGAFNNDYRWETIKKLEAELTAGFFNDRITLSTIFWRTRGYDQLGRYPLPATAGAEAVARNQRAVIENSGWDFFVNTRNINRNGFTWTTNINFGLANNKIVSIPEGTFDSYNFNRLPKPGEQFAGFVLLYKYQGVNTGNGVYQFEDRSGTSTSSPQGGYSQLLRLDTRPLTMGVSNNFSCNGLNLSFFIQLTRQIGRNYLFDNAFTAYNTGVFNNDPQFGNLPVAYTNAWTYPGQLTDLQRSTTLPFSQPIREPLTKLLISNAAWVDASFIRLRNVSLSYTLPESWVKKARLHGLTVFVHGQNLITLTRYKGLDPETQSVSVLPLLRVWDAGVRINL